MKNMQRKCRVLCACVQVIHNAERATASVLPSRYNVIRLMCVQLSYRVSRPTYILHGSLEHIPSLRNKQLHPVPEVVLVDLVELVRTAWDLARPKAELNHD